MDGEPLHFQAVNDILAEEGRSMSFEAYRPHMGTKYGWTEMVRDLGLVHPKEHYSGRFRSLMVERYRELSVALPGAVELVRDLQAAGLPLAIASSSIRPWVEACLDRIDLRDCFDLLVTGSDVERGKPAPDVYLLAARRLAVEPSSCLAIEDAPAGIQAAKSAGMVCWAVRTEYTRGLELPSPHRDLNALTEIDPADILGMAA